MSLTATTTTTTRIIIIISVGLPSNILWHALGATASAAALSESPLESPYHIRGARARASVY